MVEWQTRRSQKPLEITLRGGSTPPLGTTTDYLFMAKLTLNQAKEITREQAAKMPSDGWTVHHRLTELFEEVGELANAIQTTEGFKSQKRKKSDITNSICDVLYEIFLIADHYKIDLDKEYPLVIDEIELRRKQGAFDHENA